MFFKKNRFIFKGIVFVIEVYATELNEYFMWIFQPRLSENCLTRLIEAFINTTRDSKV